MTDIRWLDWAKEMQSVAQAGLEYSRDVYDIERFRQIRELSVRIIAEYTEVDPVVIQGLFANETGYATPKVDIRGVVCRDGKLLMVRETTDGRWSLPGGWADIGLSPKEVVVKEVKEETGFDVIPVRLLAVLDRGKHAHPPSPYHIYKVFIQCELIGGEVATSVETDAVQFYDAGNFPELSTERITLSQLQTLMTLLKNPNTDVLLD